jgi:2-alkyl-3-oxoalkanoate reductase
MLTIGIVGATGFVGDRAVEMLCEDRAIVRPIVRNPDSLKRFTAMSLDGYIANAFDASALERAFRGCDVVIHSVLGSPGLIRGSVEPAYLAAQRAGVRRLIYLSSMIVHTSAPAPGTTESSPPVRQQPHFPTHVAKIDAEQKLLRLRQKGTVEVVIFRPGMVFGPRSRWVLDLAQQLDRGTAYLIDRGRGICNTVYVDNLIHAMRLAMSAEDADRESFFVGDREQVTWFDFYRPFAEAFGIDPRQIPQVSVPQFSYSRKQQTLDAFWNSETIQKLLALVSDDFKHGLKSLIIPKQNQKLTQPVPEVLAKAQPIVTEMMAILQQSQYKLPFEKAEKILGYKPVVSFAEGCCRSIEWLAESKQFQVDPKVLDRNYFN